MPDYLATLPYCGTVAFLLRTKPVSSLAFRHADTRTQWHRDFGYGRDEICYGLARGRVLMEPLATPPGRESPVQVGAHTSTAAHLVSALATGVWI